MRLGVLFSGGKDSCLAGREASRSHRVVCLITIRSRNPESYMFHTPNIHLASLQAEAMGLPLMEVESEGRKEEELGDLEMAVRRGTQEHGIEGLVTGALASTYQATRVQRICAGLGLWCFNPLWLREPMDVLRDVVDGGYEVMISGVFAEPLGEEMLGRIIDDEFLAEMARLWKKYRVNPSGEGGEFETTVLYGPGWRYRLEIKRTETEYRNFSGRIRVLEAGLVMP